MTVSDLPLGSIIYAAVKPFFKIYLIIGCGFYLGRRNILTVDTARNLSDIVVTLALPCLLFNKMVTNLQSSDIKQIGIIGLVFCLSMIFGGIFGYLSYLLNKPKYFKGSSVAIGLLSNISDLPIAYLQTFAIGGIAFADEEGEMGISYVCIFTMFQIIFQFNLGLNKLIGYDFDQQIKNLDKDIESSFGDKKKTIVYDEEDFDQVDDEISEIEEPQNINEIHARPLHASSSASIISRTSSNGSNLSKHISHTSALEIRNQQTQTMTDIINVYSEADALKRVNSRVRPGQFTDLTVITEEEDVKLKEKSKFKKVLLFFLDNMKKPISIVLVVAVIIAMIPWVKGLFVTAQPFVHIPNAPDEMPPLSFIMDFTAYLGNACVPLGLLILGSTLSRLAVGEMQQGYWITPLCLSIYKLVISPIIGVCIILGLSKANFFPDDRMLKFICTIVWCLPNATSLIYITAFYSPVDDHRFHQMDYLALCYMIQYPLLVIALPFLTTFTMKCLF